VFAAATASYAANCALGASVALGIVDTRNVRWVHHALYLATFSLAVGAMSSAVWGSPRRSSRQAAAMLAPAAVPLALIPYAGTRSRRHPLVALTAAPFLVAALLRSTLPTTRREQAWNCST
jgi:hypothetical protein